MNKPIKLKKGDSVSYRFMDNPKLYRSEVRDDPDYSGNYPLIELTNGHEFRWNGNGFYSRDLGVYLIVNDQTN